METGRGDGAVTQQETEEGSGNTAEPPQVTLSKTVCTETELRTADPQLQVWTPEMKSSKKFSGTPSIKMTGRTSPGILPATTSPYVSVSTGA